MYRDRDRDEKQGYIHSIQTQKLETGIDLDTGTGIEKGYVVQDV